MSGKTDFSNPAKLSSSGGIFAGAGFLQDLESCQFRPEPEPKSGTALLVCSLWLNATTTSLQFL